jgi:hypothetical protein
MKTDNQFRELAEQLAREELEMASRLRAAGYDDLMEKVADGEIDIRSAMQIFDGQQPFDSKRTEYACPDWCLDLAAEAAAEIGYDLDVD